MKPSKFLLNPVRALNLFLVGGVGEGWGAGGLSVFHYFVLLVCIS